MWHQGSMRVFALMKKSLNNPNPAMVKPLTCSSSLLHVNSPSSPRVLHLLFRCQEHVFSPLNLCAFPFSACHIHSHFLVLSPHLQLFVLYRTRVLLAIRHLFFLPPLLRRRENYAAQEVANTRLCLLLPWLGFVEVDV